MRPNQQASDPVKILLFHRSSAATASRWPEGLTIELWRPSWNRFTPPDKGSKYFLYWLFHFAGIFKNKDYASLLVYKQQQLVTSMLVVPAYFKWPFMNKNDLQFTYVMTRPGFRGQGVAEKAINYAMDRLAKDGRSFWYVTDDRNKPSIALCTKAGFEFFNYGVRTRYFKIIKSLTQTS